MVSLIFTPIDAKTSAQEVIEGLRFLGRAPFACCIYLLWFAPSSTLQANVTSDTFSAWWWSPKTLQPRQGFSPLCYPASAGAQDLTAELPEEPLLMGGVWWPGLCRPARPDRKVLILQRRIAE